MRKVTTFLLIAFLILFSSSVYANPVKKLYEIGVTSYAQGKYNNAISIFKKSLEIYPRFAPAYNYIGLSYRELGTDNKDVAWYFEKAIEFNPEYVQAYDNLGKTYYQLGEFDKAEEVITKALELKPELISAKLSLAWVLLLGQSRPDEAIGYFEEVLEDIDHTYALFGLGIAYFMNDERLKVFDIITKLKQDDENTLATQLENMVRDNKIAPSLKAGAPLFFSEQPRSILVDDFPDFSQFEMQKAKSPEVKGMKVRLRKDSSLGKQPLKSSGGNSVMELQRNDSNTPRVKYYY